MTFVEEMELMQGAQRPPVAGRSDRKSRSDPSGCWPDNRIRRAGRSPPLVAGGP